MKLSDGTLLQGGKYKIVRFISHGGFGCTYEALNTTARNRRVAIKELFVSDFCNRDNSGVVTVATHSKLPLFDKLRGKFLDEADTLYNLNHPGIVRVLDSFEENGTAYYVMDYIEGCSLRDYVQRNGAMSESRALGYIRALSDALQYVHSKDILHLDIKPANVMVTHDNKVVLIDFGVSKQYDEVSGENTSTLLGRSPGYAPVEQMKNSVGTFMPATDIYALGATLYNLLSGVTPPESTDIAAGDAPPPLPDGVSEATRRAVERAMAINKYNRPQSVAEFVALLDGKGVESVDEATLIDDEESSRRHHTGDTTIVDGDKEKKKAQPAKKNSGDSTNTPDPDKEKNSERGLWILLAVLVAFIVGVALIVGGEYNQPQERKTAKKAKEARIVGEPAEQAHIEVEPAEPFRIEAAPAAPALIEAAQTYEVGDYYNQDGLEGVVFEVSDGGRHGKIVSMDESSNILQWCTYEQYDKEIAVGASSETDGKYNTDKIAQYGLSNYPAAQWCRAKGSNWYLPAKNELKAICNNRSVINTTLEVYGGDKMYDDAYWSSTEYEESWAWFVTMTDGYTHSLNKRFDNYVRAVSAF